MPSPTPVALAHGYRLDSAFRHLGVDVTTRSIHMAIVRDALRRQHVPERAIRGGVADELTTYGPGVVAFADDDARTGGAGALRLLRLLACQSGGVSEKLGLLLRWRADLHVVLQATAGMAQSS